MHETYIFQKNLAKQINLLKKFTVKECVKHFKKCIPKNSNSTSNP